MRERLALPTPSSGNPNVDSFLRGLQQMFFVTVDDDDDARVVSVQEVDGGDLVDYVSAALHRLNLQLVRDLRTYWIADHEHNGR